MQTSRAESHMKREASAAPGSRLSKFAQGYAERRERGRPPNGRESQDLRGA